MNGKPNWNGARLNRNAEKPIYVRIGKNWQNKIGAEQEQQGSGLRAHWEELAEQDRAERELERAERQAVLNNLVQINNALTQLLAERQNGRSSPEN